MCCRLSRALVPRHTTGRVGVSSCVRAHCRFGLAVTGQWRPAIHLPLADPYQPPEGYHIKANTHSGLYYTPESELYDNTVPEVWFASEDVAQANGFIRAPE